jgi:DNA modification methylase
MNYIRKESFKTGVLYNADSLNLLKDESEIKSKTVNLVITSPPYADVKDKVNIDGYYGKPIEEFIDWFIEISKEVSRVLTDNGSFVINIDSFYNPDKTRNTYIYELILEITKRTNLKLIQDLYWIKSNILPNGLTTKYIRFRSAVEQLLWFSKDPENVKINTKRVIEPLDDKQIKKLTNQLKSIESNRKYMPSGNSINKYKIYKTMLENNGSTPFNYIYGTTVSGDEYSKQMANTMGVKHPAKFPLYLPEFFILSMTDENDVVLDPFIGSGTVAEVCIKYNRKWIGIELSEQYYNAYVRYRKKQDAIKLLENFNNEQVPV